MEKNNPFNSNKNSLYGYKLNNFKNKYPLISEPISLTLLMLILNGVFNISNRNLIINNSNQFMINYANKNELDIMLNTYVDNDKLVQDKIYEIIVNKIYNNLFYDLKFLSKSSYLDDQYFLYYLPITNSDFHSWINENLSNILNTDEEKEFFYQHYSFVEDKIIQFLSSMITFYEAVNSNQKSLTSKEIRELRNDFLKANRDEKILKFLPETINSELKNLNNYNHEEKTYLFQLCFSTMNSYVFNHLLIAYPEYYKHLQESNPLIIIDFLNKQKDFFNFYLSINISNLDTLIYSENGALSTRDLIINFYDIVYCYPNFISLINYQIDRLDRMINDKSIYKFLNNDDLNNYVLGLNLFDIKKNFNDLVNIQSIPINNL